MIEDESSWRPGSFTKNFGWGSPADGLKLLHEAINIGFDGRVENVTRSEFRSRIKRMEKTDYIPLQFFLYNSVFDNQDTVVADELVFQAIHFKHDEHFDKLGMFAFILSLVGRWKGAKTYQSRPAEWARHFVIDFVGKKLNWDASSVTANDIENYVQSDKRYVAKGARKLSTNLNYLFRLGHLEGFNSPRIEKWWVNAAFLALDRTVLERRVRNQGVNENNFYEYLVTAGFNQISGPRNMRKDLATKHVAQLYSACGGIERLSDQDTRRLIELRLPQSGIHISNNPEPVAAVNRADPSIQKTIPRLCAQLAKEFADFEIMDIEELEQLDLNKFIHDQTTKAIEALRSRGIAPTMTAEELFKITRNK